MAPVYICYSIHFIETLLTVLLLEKMLSEAYEYFVSGDASVCVCKRKTDCEKCVNIQIFDTIKIRQYNKYVKCL